MDQFGSGQSDRGQGALIDSSGNVYVIGAVMGPLGSQSYKGMDDAFIRKYKADGTEMWARLIGTTSNDEATAVTADSQGFLYVTGAISGALPGLAHKGDKDVFVVKYDSDGGEKLALQFGADSPTSSDIAYGIAVDGNGVIYVAGTTTSALPDQQYEGKKDAFIRALDAKGLEVWTKQFGAAGDDEIRALTMDSQGALYVAGRVESPLPGQTHSGNRDAFVRRYDLSGNEVWTRQFGTFGDDDALDVAVDENGNVYVVGNVEGALEGQTWAALSDAFVRKYDSAGNLLWTRQFGFFGIDGASAVAIGRDGNVFVAGKVEGALPGQTQAGFTDAFVRKYSPTGSELWARQMGSPANDSSLGIATGGNGIVVVTGEAEGTLLGLSHLGGKDAFAIQISQ